METNNENGRVVGVMPSSKVRSYPPEAYKIGTPEYWRRHADMAERGGNRHLAEMFRREPELQEKRERERVLGANWLTPTNAAYFMAACLRSRRRMPAGAAVWMAQQALEDWLPAIPSGELREILPILRECSEKRLGKRLAAVVAKQTERLGRESVRLAAAN